MSSDLTMDISALRNMIVKFFSGDFDHKTFGLFKLTSMFAFVKDDRGGKRPVVAGGSLGKSTGKAMAINITFYGRKLVEGCNIGCAPGWGKHGGINGTGRSV